MWANFCMVHIKAFQIVIQHRDYLLMENYAYKDFVYVVIELTVFHHNNHDQVMQHHVFIIDS